MSPSRKRADVILLSTMNVQLNFVSCRINQSDANYLVSATVARLNVSNCTCAEYLPLTFHIIKLNRRVYTGVKIIEIIYFDR